ncbi:microtubule-associated protein 70-2 [Trifolium repens]|nr:microtubule-associated protein 70-2 [Trifolium repens]
MVRCEKQYGEELPLVLSDPMVLEINRLQNQFKEKVKELAIYQSEIKALKTTEALKDKAIVELRNDVSKLDERLSVTEDYLKQKSVEIKKLADEKKGALAAQYAAEATLRRVHANQKDEYSVPIDTVIAPLEAEIKMYRNEITTLQEDKKALERIKKSKETALIEAERILQSTLEKALIIEEVQNQNFDLKRQIEIFQEENKILEKTLRQKIIEVEKLSHTIQELEEVILANGANANVVRDYRRQLTELQEEKRTLERELSRVKVSANRVANVVANEWKDENDKVMPVRQWLEERRIMQAEIQRLKEKLVISERTAKAESQLKRNIKINTNTVGGNLKQESPMKMKYASAENMLKKGTWTSRSKVADITGEKENEMQVNTDINTNNIDVKTIDDEDEDFQSKKPNDSGSDDVVSGFLYDRLQKDVIKLRKSCETKDGSLQAKDEEIKMLMKKVDALTKAMEVEWKKMKREAAAREKEVSSIMADDNRKNRNTNSSKRAMKER